jgi:hypothetical protein
LRAFHFVWSRKAYSLVSAHWSARWRERADISERTGDIPDNRPKEGEIKGRKVRLGRLVVFAFVFR